jgi:hypothetical protein
MAPKSTPDDPGPSSFGSEATAIAGHLLKPQKDYTRVVEEGEDGNYVPEEPVDTTGDQFEPLAVPDGAYLAHELPPTPLKLFQVFVRGCMVEDWVKVTNRGPPLEPGQRPQIRWNGTSVPEVYLWIGYLLYMDLHSARHFEDYWDGPTRCQFDAYHPVSRFMTYDRFFLLHTRLQIEDLDTADLRNPSATLNWSFLLEAVSRSWKLQQHGHAAWKPYRLRTDWKEALMNEIFNTYGKEHTSSGR